MCEDRLGGARWLRQFLVSQESAQQIAATEWAGRQLCKQTILFDYQESPIKIQYKKYIQKIHNHKADIESSERLCDVIYYYLNGLQYLDKDYAPEKGQLLMCSGMRTELDYLLHVNPCAKAIVSIRNFSGFCTSFLRYRYQKEISEKTQDYVYIA